MQTTYAFARRGPDRVTEELAAIFSTKASFEFKALFLLVHANLKARNAASGGEEMLRLRAYEKLQNLVQAGVVNKVGKEYCGVPSALALLHTQMLNAVGGAPVLSPSAPKKKVRKKVAVAKTAVSL